MANLQNTTFASCADCGRQLGLEERPCRSCRSSRKAYSVNLFESVSISAKIGRIVKTVEWKKRILAPALIVGCVGAFTGLLEVDKGTSVIIGLVSALGSWLIGLGGSSTIIDRETRDA